MKGLCAIRGHLKAWPSRFKMAMSKVATNALRVALFLLLVAVILVATLVFHVQDHIGDILDWIEEHRVAGSVSFVALYALFTGVWDAALAHCTVWGCHEQRHVMSGAATGGSGIKLFSHANMFRSF